MYGTQAKPILLRFRDWFENDVKMYGTQADVKQITCNAGLRMM